MYEQPSNRPCPIYVLTSTIVNFPSFWDLPDQLPAQRAEGLYKGFPVMLRRSNPAHRWTVID